MAEVEIGGATIKGGRLMLLVPIVSALGGGLWGGFEFYKDYMDMKEIIQTIDYEKISSENNLIISKLEDAIVYSREIRNTLLEDIRTIEAYVDKIDSRVSKSNDSIKETQNSIDATLESVLDSMNEVQKDVTASIREVEGLIRESEKDVRDTMRETVNNVEADMNKLEEQLNERIQEALDNPLSN